MLNDSRKGQRSKGSSGGKISSGAERDAPRADVKRQRQGSSGLPLYSVPSLLVVRSHVCEYQTWSFTSSVDATLAYLCTQFCCMVCTWYIYSYVYRAQEGISWLHIDTYIWNAVIFRCFAHTHAHISIWWYHRMSSV